MLSILLVINPSKYFCKKNWSNLNVNFMSLICSQNANLNSDYLSLIFCINEKYVFFYLYINRYVQRHSFRLS